MRHRAYAGLVAIARLQFVSPPPDPLATALVAAKLPPEIDAELFGNALREKHRVTIKMIEKRWFNGVRLSPHIFNNEADVDAALLVRGRREAP